MQATKIKVGERYYIDSKALVYPFGAFRNGNVTRPKTLTVVEKGIQRPGYVRADGVKVEMTAEEYQPIMDWIDERVRRRETPEQKMAERDTLRGRYPRQIVVSSRSIEESVSQRDKRLEAEERARIEAVAWRENEMRDKAGEVTLAKVGEMIAEAEREVAQAARVYRRNLQNIAARTQTDIAAINEVTDDDDFTLKLAEGQEVWPRSDDYYMGRALTTLTESRERYVKAQARHAKWVKMVNGE